MSNNVPASAPLVAPLFRGATKPVMYFGVPLNALVMVLLPGLLLMILLWGYLSFFSIVLMLPACVGIPIMRQMTKRDDQYLNMWILEIKERMAWTVKNRLGDVAVIPPKSLRHRRFIKE